jgi:hypothetical protein
MLQGCIMVLRFDRYTSNPIPISNGIGQGDPLSMIIYQFYNANILELPKEIGESAIVYIDDSILIAMASTFVKTHKLLVNKMRRLGGVLEWSTTHNSPLEHSKLVLIDFAHRSKSVERTPLRLPQGAL